MRGLRAEQSHQLLSEQKKIQTWSEMQSLNTHIPSKIMKSVECKSCDMRHVFLECKLQIPNRFCLNGYPKAERCRLGLLDPPTETHMFDSFHAAPMLVTVLLWKLAHATIVLAEAMDESNSKSSHQISTLHELPNEHL